MSITTKKGDDGTTGLFGGGRVSKADVRIEAIGALDEATSFIGLAREAISDKDVRLLLSDVQTSLYRMMAYMSGAPFQEEALTNHRAIIEKKIVTLENTLPPLSRFVLPQGGEESARLHVARVIVRKAERRVVGIFGSTKSQTTEEKSILQYLNRLSDLLFLYARAHDAHEKTL